MPHLIARSFDPDSLAKNGSGFVVQGGKEDNVWLYDAGTFLLEIKKRARDYVIKADKITKPAQTERIKEQLDSLAKKLGLEIIQSNINTKGHKSPGPFLKSPAFFENVRPQSRVRVEIGFGSGRHLLHQAGSHPQTQFIGIEVHTPSINQVLKQIRLQELHNVWIVNYDARLLLELLPSNSVETIYLHFPVPWDKKPHRRVLSRSFVDESMRVCEKEGRLNLRTDSENYFAYSLQVFNGLEQCAYRVRKNEDIEISSKYEDRWKKMEKNIYDLDLFCRHHSQPKAVGYDFSFNLDPESVDIAALMHKTYTFEHFFIHFQNRYSGRGVTLLKVSFGKFDKPENRYIKIDQTGVAYLYTDPVGTTTNFLAHEKIRELLHYGKCS